MFADGSLSVRRIWWLLRCSHLMVPLCVVVYPVGARLTAVCGASLCPVAPPPPPPAFLRPTPRPSPRSPPPPSLPTAVAKPLNILDEMKGTLQYQHGCQEVPAAYWLRETVGVGGMGRGRGHRGAVNLPVGTCTVTHFWLCFVEACFVKVPCSPSVSSPQLVFCPRLCAAKLDPP